MAEYIFAVQTIKYGTPTGTASLPVNLASLPDTVKGSITVEETEGAVVKFFTDQKRQPIKIVKTEEGDLSVTMQFYDYNWNAFAAFKGGVAVTGGSAKFTPATGYTNVEKAIAITFESGHDLNMFNANCIARMTGGGGRDTMLAWELKATSQMTADLTGSWELTA